jgi:lipopolysaccharide export system permease protein
VAGLFVAFAVALGQFVAPPLDRAAHIKRAQALSATVAIQSDRGFWSRADHRFLRVSDIRAGGILGGVEIYEFDDEGRLRRFTHARRAEIQAGRPWQLTDVVQKACSSSPPRWAASRSGSTSATTIG